MKWVKRGLIFRPARHFGWMKTHAQLPTALVKRDVVRIYFSSRPRKDLSLTSFLDLERQDLSKVLYVHPDPILPLGGAGQFDEHGLMPSSVVEYNGLVLLYYTGWSRCRDVPYRNFMGLAISQDGGRTFRKHSGNPIIGRSANEPYSATSPSVYAEAGWHMWYCSGTAWIPIGERLEHTYQIKHAVSRDGRNWTATNAIAIRQASEQEALTRPTIIRLRDAYHMWFCTRGSRDFRGGRDSYRIGYARSADLKNWSRDDRKAGITPSKSGWDSEMVAYPEVAQVAGRILMFYNGNGFGASGFGYATLVTEESDDGEQL